MPFVKYTLAQKREAVALATVAGLAAAAEQLGIPEATIASWAAKAGKDPADSIAPASWEAIAEAARAQVGTWIAKGKLSAAQLVNLAGMAEQRAAAKPKPDEDDDENKRIVRWMEATYPDPRQRRLARDVIDCLLIDAIREADSRMSESSETPDDDPPPSVDLVAELGSILAGIPDLEAWLAEWQAARAVRQAEEDRQRAIELEERTARSKRAQAHFSAGLSWAAAWEAAGDPTNLPDSVTALLARAEAYLEETDDARTTAA